MKTKLFFVALLSIMLTLSFFSYGQKKVSTGRFKPVYDLSTRVIKDNDRIDPLTKEEIIKGCPAIRVRENTPVSFFVGGGDTNIMKPGERIRIMVYYSKKDIGQKQAEKLTQKTGGLPAGLQGIEILESRQTLSLADLNPLISGFGSQEKNFVPCLSLKVAKSKICLMSPKGEYHYMVLIYKI